MPANRGNTGSALSNNVATWRFGCYLGIKGRQIVRNGCRENKIQPKQKSPLTQAFWIGAQDWTRTSTACATTTSR